MVALLKENYLISALGSALQIYFADSLGISGFPMPSYASLICLLSLPFRRQDLRKAEMQFLYLGWQNLSQYFCFGEYETVNWLCNIML